MNLSSFKRFLMRQFNMMMPIIIAMGSAPWIISSEDYFSDLIEHSLRFTFVLYSIKESTTS